MIQPSTCPTDTRLSTPPDYKQCLSTPSTHHRAWHMASSECLQNEWTGGRRQSEQEKLPRTQKDIRKEECWVFLALQVGGLTMLGALLEGDESSAHLCVSLVTNDTQCTQWLLFCFRCFRYIVKVVFSSRGSLLEKPLLESLICAWTWFRGWGLKLSWWHN